jgi:hypothetical protein
MIKRSWSVMGQRTFNLENTMKFLYAAALLAVAGLSLWFGLAMFYTIATHWDPRWPSEGGTYWRLLDESLLYIPQIMAPLAVAVLFAMWALIVATAQPAKATKKAH